uniref:Uncharacterized protein n=1 Tax=Ralstonia solanacearum TaxID=305 RepID=O82961_RALSL|nr:unnamed protein product [Ralstonia solanacearum]
MYVPGHTRCSVPPGALRASTVLHLVNSPMSPEGPLAAPTTARTLPTLDAKKAGDPHGLYIFRYLFVTPDRTPATEPARASTATARGTRPGQSRPRPPRPHPPRSLPSNPDQPTSAAGWASDAAAPELRDAAP